MVRLNKHQAATFIQKQWRGHLGRQRFFAELLAQERNRVKSTKKVKEKKLDEMKLHQPKKQQLPSPKQYKQAPRSNSRDSLDDNRDLDDDDEEDIIVYRANKKAPLIKASDIQSSVSHSVDSLRRSDASISLNSPQRLPRQQNPHNPLLYQQQVDVSSDSLNPDQYPLEMIEEEDDIIRDSLTNTRIPTIKLQKQSSNLLTTTSSSNATPSPHHHNLLSHKSPKHLNPLTKSPSRKMEVHDKSNHNHHHHPSNHHHNMNNENDEESDWKNPVDEFEEEEEKRKKNPPKQSRQLSDEDRIDELSPRHLIELKEFMYDIDDDGDENEDSLELPIQTIIKKNLPIVKAQPSSHPTTSNNPTVIKSNHNTSVVSSSPAASQRHTNNPLPSHPTTNQPQPTKVSAAVSNSNIPRFPSNKRPVNGNPSEAVSHQSQQKTQVRSGSGLGGLGGGIGGDNSDNDQDNALETIIDKEKFERLKRLYEESSSINDIIAANSPQKKTVQAQIQPQPQPPQITKPFVSPRPDHITPKHTQQHQQPPLRQQQPLPQSDRIDRNDDNQSKVSYSSQQSTALRSENTPRTNRQQDHNNHQRPISGNHNNHQIPQQPHIPSNQQRNTNNNHHAFPDDISQISDDFSYQPHQRRGSGGIGGGRGQGRKNSVEAKGKNNNNEINSDKIQQNLPPRHQQPPNNDYREYNDQLSQYSNQPSQNNNYNRQNQALAIQPPYVEEGYSSQYQQQIPSPHRLKQQQPPPIQQQQQQQGYYQNQYQPPPQQQQAPPLNKGGGVGGNPPPARQQPPPNQPIPNHKQPPPQQPNQPSNQPGSQKKKPPGQSNGVRGGGINPSASEELEAQLLREIAMLNQKQSHLINHLFDHPSADINGHPQVPGSPQKKSMGGGGVGGGGGVAVPSENNKPRKKEADPKKQKEKLAFGPAAKDFRSKEKDVKEKDKEVEIDKKRGGKAIIEGIEPVNPAQIVKEWQQAAYRDQYQQPPNHPNHPKQSLPQGMVYQSPEKVRSGGGGGPLMQSPDQPVSLQPSGYLQHFDVKHQYHQQKQRSHSANRQRRNIYDPHDSKSEGGVSSHFSSQQGGKKENLSLPPLISDQRQAQQQIINAQGGYQHPLQQQNRRVANSSRQSTRSAPLHY